MSILKRITIDLGICHGKACVAGTRIRLLHFLELAGILLLTENKFHMGLYL